MPKVADVIEFCLKFDIPINDRPGMIDPLLLLQRVGLIKEEAIELAGAAEQLTIAPTQKDAEDLLDAAVDLVYATIATVVAHGYDFDEAWSRVHRANMAKERAPDANNKRGSTFDVVKPEGWRPPSHRDLTEQPYSLGDLLCEESGLLLHRSLQTQSGPISLAEIERSFREFNGALKASMTT